MPAKKTITPTGVARELVRMRKRIERAEKSTRELKDTVLALEQILDALTE